MGATYSIFEDIPPSITFLNNQKQTISMETRLIVFYLDNFTTTKVGNTTKSTTQNNKSITKVASTNRLYLRYKNLINLFKNKGFIVLTIVRNLETVLTDPTHGMIGALLSRISNLQERYCKQNIQIDISSFTFMSCGDSCANLLKLFDSASYITTNKSLYQKIKSDKRSATINVIASRNAKSPNITNRSDLMKNISSIILINPTYQTIKFVPKTVKIDKEVRIIFTGDHEKNEKKSSLLNIGKFCTKIIGDRIDGVKSSDLTMNSRRNIDLKEKNTQKITDIVCHIIDGIYEAINRDTS